jgi:Asp-tRNA(Asn)/Glu-tRNA(Gln) amidotransferase A subunit family amidase
MPYGLSTGEVPHAGRGGAIIDIVEYGAWTASEKIEAGELTSEALVRACLERIAAREGDVHAWSYIDPEAAMAVARACDRAPRRGPLHGIPIGIKDLIDSADMPTTYGSRIYSGWRPKVDASAITLLKRAGAIMLGKTVTQAFGCGIPIEVNNGLNPDFTAGGSSSGSAAAVAARMVPLALGSQSASSLIRPCSYNGVVGMRPSFGTMSLAGFKYFNGSFDSLGLIARSVDDIALLWQVQVGVELEKIVASPPPRIGLCRSPWWKFAEPASRQALEGAARVFKQSGAEVFDFELPSEFNDLHEAHKIMQAFEAAHAYAWEYDNHRDLLDESVLGIIDLGRKTTYPQYLALLRRAQPVRARFDALMQGVDAVVAPSAPGEPPPSRRVAGGGFVMGDPVMSRGWTLLHVPCITLPHFTGPQGMPVGIQLIGAFGEDEKILSLAKLAEVSFARA